MMKTHANKTMRSIVPEFLIPEFIHFHFFYSALWINHCGVIVHDVAHHQISNLQPRTPILFEFSRIQVC